jgi:hypothetical protein
MFYFDLPFNSPPKERKMDELCKRLNEFLKYLKRRDLVVGGYFFF